MKLSGIIKIATASVLSLTLLSSCGFAERNTGSKKEAVRDAETTAASAAEDAAENSASAVTGLVAKKFFSFDHQPNFLKGGIVYQDGEKKGIRSYGVGDTGAIYDYVEDFGDHFIVSRRYGLSKTSDKVKDVNVLGIVDGSGKTICSDTYAYIKELNDRYAEVYEAVEKVSDDQDGLKLYRRALSSSYYISLYGNENDTVYSAKKSIFDLKTGKFIKEADVPYLSETGNVESFSDGSYLISTTETDTVYDDDGEVLFTYNPNEFSLYKYNAGYYVAEKIKDGVRSYFLLDRSGNKVSAEFDSYNMNIFGSVIVTNDSLYDFDGKPVIDGTYGSINYDWLSKDLFVLENKKDFTFINGSGDVLLTGKEGDGVNVYEGSGLAEKQDEGFYDFADKAYSVSGYRAYSVGHLMVKISDGDGRYDLIDVTDGSMLCEGYKDYSAGSPVNGCCYVAAQRTEGGYDIYKIQNKVDNVKNSFEDDAIIDEIQLAKIYEMKEDLFAELEKAFADAGLKATVDRENAQVTFDSAVIFEGDSSKLSAEGKSLLDKFVSAYIPIITNEKYNGFVAKTIVEGHTAPQASSTYESGLPLSQERADKVRDYCKSVDAKAGAGFEAVGYSNNSPVYKLDGTVDMDASRRVTFKSIINNEF